MKGMRDITAVPHTAWSIPIMPSRPPAYDGLPPQSGDSGPRYRLIGCRCGAPDRRPGAELGQAQAGEKTPREALWVRWRVNGFGVTFHRDEDLWLSFLPGQTAEGLVHGTLRMREGQRGESL